MDNIELFYRIIQSEIRRKHIKFLKGQTCLPNGEPPEEIITAADLSKFKKFSFFGLLWFVKRFSYIKRIKLIKRYNKGIEAALRVLDKEFKAYSNRSN